MPVELRIGILVFSLIFILIVLNILKKGRIPVKYSLIWLFSAFLMVLVALMPNFLFYITDLIGFETMSNMIIGILLAILLFVTMMLTIIVSGQKEKIRLLIQEISIIKEKLNK